MIIYHIIIYSRVVAKKVAVCVTIDGTILRELDSLLREIQIEEIKSKKSLSTRSSIVERLIRDGLNCRRSD